MELSPTRVNRLLLVEDSRGDAEAVRLCLSAEGTGDYEIFVVQTLGAAFGYLEREKIDIVLLDLTLPDSTGLETIARLYAAAADLPIVVLTGSDDERLALCCIQAGAQDYICKSDMTPHTLRRALGYALGRMREGQMQALRTMLQGCQALSSQQMNGTVTRTLAGIGPIKDRSPDAFAQFQDTYGNLLERYMEYLRVKVDKPRDLMEILATRLGDLGATPRDMIDIHVGALDAAARKLKQSRVPAFASDGRLFALEMMGLLVDYYRLSFRRLFPERPRQ
ncbi:MAG: response regulator [Rhodospirillaceae bacterium]